MSNPAMAKSWTPRKALPTTPRGLRTIKPSFDTLSRVGFLNAIDLSLSSTMHRSSLSSRCCTRKSKRHQRQQFRETWRRSMAFQKSMSGRHFRFVPHNVFLPQVWHTLFSEEIPWAHTCGIWWLDFPQRYLIPRGGRPYCSRRSSPIISLGFYHVSSPSRIHRNNFKLVSFNFMQSQAEPYWRIPR
jgi:hypothetical protein